MTPKILEQLERAANAEDDEALAIFRHLSESLDNLGMSWTSLARAQQSVVNAGEDRPLEVDDAMSKRIASLTATEDLGAYLRRAHEAVPHIERAWAGCVRDERWQACFSFMRAEEIWLKDGFIDANTLENLSYVLPALGLEINSLEECFGFAQESWLETHLSYLNEKRASRDAEEFKLLGEVRETCHRKSVIAGGLKHEILKCVREDPELIELWCSAIRLKRPQSDNLDLKGLEKALNNENTKAARVAIAFLADVEPADLWVYHPEIDDIRTGAYRYNIKRHELDKELGLFTKGHASNFRGHRGLEVFRAHIKAYMDKVPDMDLAMELDGVGSSYFVAS